jgi:glycosyltransferase involved in cell wall biosynthesis
VGEADCGCYVEPEDPAHFEKIIREYLSNDAKRLMQGENGYRYAKQNFDRNVLALKYLEILKNV